MGTPARWMARKTVERAPFNSEGEGGVPAGAPQEDQLGFLLGSAACARDTRPLLVCCDRMRLPQVSSRTAVVTGPICSGSWVNLTPRGANRSTSLFTSAKEVKAIPSAAARRWLAAASFVEQAFHAPDDALFSVGVYRYVGRPSPSSRAAGCSSLSLIRNVPLAEPSAQRLARQRPTGGEGDGAILAQTTKVRSARWTPLQR